MARYGRGPQRFDQAGGAPSEYEMVGLDCTIIMHPQVWKCSGHYDLFCDYMVDCRESKKRYRFDQVRGRWVEHKGVRIFVTTMVEADQENEETQRKACKYFNLRNKDAEQLQWDSHWLSLEKLTPEERAMAWGQMPRRSER